MATEADARGSRRFLYFTHTVLVSAFLGVFNAFRSSVLRNPPHHHHHHPTLHREHVGRRGHVAVSISGHPWPFGLGGFALVGISPALSIGISRGTVGILDNGQMEGVKRRLQNRKIWHNFENLASASSRQIPRPSGRGSIVFVAIIRWLGIGIFAGKGAIWKTEGQEE